MKTSVYVNNDEFDMIKKSNAATKEDDSKQFVRYLMYVGETVFEELKQLGRLDECKEELGYSYENDIKKALVYSINAEKLDGEHFIVALDKRVPGIRDMYGKAIREILNHDVMYQKQQIVKEVIELVHNINDGVVLTVEDVETLRREFPILLNVFIYDYMIEIVTKVGTFHLISPNVEMPDVTVNKSTYFCSAESHILSHTLAQTMGGDVVTGYVTGDLPNNNLYRSWVLKDNMVYDVTTGYKMSQDEYYDLFEVEEINKINHEELKEQDAIVHVINNDTKEERLIPYITYQRILTENEKYKTLHKHF